MSMESLTEHFQHYFRVTLADTPELIEQIYRIRYEIYCKEFHYEREEDCPGGQECDDFDQQSIHCLVIHRASNIPAGCVRLVKTRSDDPSYLLPFEKVCGDSLRQEALQPSRLLRASLCEISRLAVRAEFRKRMGESESPWGHVSALNFTAQERRTFPLISTVLALAAISLVALTQRRHIFAMMEPRLARLLHRSGLEFIQIGSLMEYHGLRAAFHLAIEDALHGMKGELREMYDFIYHCLKTDLTRTQI